MGKKGSRSKEAKENLKNPPHNDRYGPSLDYCTEGGNPCPCGGCYARERHCSGVDYCCSREICSPNRRSSPPWKDYTGGGGGGEHFTREDGRRKEDRRCKEEGRKLLKKSGMEIIVFNDKQLNVRQRPSSCSSCSSCESCNSDSSSFTRIELTNHLFTSPLQSTEGSFYQSPYGPSSDAYSRNEKRPSKEVIKARYNREPSFEGPSRSPRRKGGSYAEDYRRHEDRSFSNNQNKNNLLKSPKRANSFNGGPSFLEEWNRESKGKRGRNDERIFNQSDSPDRRMRRTSKTRIRQQTAISRSPSSRTPAKSFSNTPLSRGTNTPPSRNTNTPPSRNTNTPPSRGSNNTPPSRSTTKTRDSGVGRSYPTSGSSGKSFGSSNSDEEKENKQMKKMIIDGERKKRKEKETETHKNQEQTELLNKMVSQTREHRKQIKTLENELERLRITGDGLATCEVNQRDVEWRPGDVVGEGSFSMVYKGVYCGTEVAVKELKCKLSQDDKNYFRSEAALLQQLHHPRVVLLMGVCTVAARPFMLLEYLSGGTLHTLIHTTTRERLDHAAYFVVAKDIAQGVNYLHRHDPQVLHLDLKSMNVLLDGYTRAKIADFGFSILRRKRGGSAVERGSIRGTPAWMAPELLTKGEVSVKCDVYSYAVILWEMLTAAHPFQGLDIYHIMEAVEAGVRPPLPNSGVSAELRELITSCWAQNPSLRPSFEEVLGALETASLPASWRKVLHRASIEPSALADVTTARAIIGMIERSVDLLERSNGRNQDRSEFQQISNEGRRNEQRRNNKEVSKRSESSNERRRLLEPSSSRGHRRSQSRGVDATFVDKERKVSRSSSPTKRDRRSSSHRREAQIVKNKQSVKIERGGGRVQAQEVRRETKMENGVQRRSSSPSKGSRVDTGRSRSSGRTSNFEVAYVTQQSQFPSSMETTISSKTSSDDLRLQHVDETDHSDQSLDRVRKKIHSYIKEPNQRVRNKSAVRQSRNRSISTSRSPTRSPQRRQRSPKRRPEVGPSERKADPRIRYPGPMLTAEQLVSQKQRLRPVRPSALRDLSLLPQSSLNDISYILKRAMSHRRDALEQLHSGRDTVLSKDMQDWADWF